MSGNAFDPANYPDGVPAVLYSGDRWAFTLSDLSARHPSPDYTAALVLIRQNAIGQRYEFAAPADAEGVFTVEVSGKDPAPGTTPWSGAVAADEYFWKVRITRASDGEDVTGDQGYVTVRPSLEIDGDVRPHTLIVLQNIRAVIEGTASNEQASYSVAGRSLSRRTPQELIELEQEYAQKWEGEKAQIDREAGRPAQSHKTLIQLDA